MNILNEYLFLNNGSKMPLLGLGTSKMENKNELRYTFDHAINIGYRHFDMAPIYQNQSFIGDFFLERLEPNKFEKNLTRSDLFLTSKIWNTHHQCIKGSVISTLKSLKTDYLDLLLIHWPVTFAFDVSTNQVIRDKYENPIIEEFNPIKIWKKMERQVEKGWVRSIGVSNFGIKNLEIILENCSIRPSVIQIESHPYFQNRKVIDFCKNEKIVVVASSPLGGTVNSEMPKMLEDTVLKKLSEKYDISVARVILSYTAISRNIGIIPRTTINKYLVENTMLVELEPSDVKEIDSLERNLRYYDPEIFGKNRFD